jgi:hypothetical protein
VIVEHQRHHFPAFVFLDETGNFEPSHLLIQRVQQLLAGRCSRERGAMMFRPAKTAEIQETFTGPGERHAHAIEKVNNRGRHFAHGFRRRLMGKKVTAVNRVVKMHPR